MESQYLMHHKDGSPVTRKDLDKINREIIEEFPGSVESSNYGEKIITIKHKIGDDLVSINYKEERTDVDILSDNLPRTKFNLEGKLPVTLKRLK